MHLTTSIIHGFCIAKTFLQVIDFLQPFHFFETSASARAGHYLVAYGQLSRCPAFHPEPRSISRFWSFLRLQDGVLTMDGCADCMLPQNWYKSKEMFFFSTLSPKLFVAILGPFGKQFWTFSCLLHVSLRHVMHMT